MKKQILTAVLALFVAVLVAPSVNAQMLVPKAMTTTAYGNTLDTVDNTEQHVTTPSDGLIKHWKNGVTAQVVVTKISGTVGGSIALQGSMNGADWTTIGSAATATDASGTYSFNSTVRWYYYRISYTGTGTMSASFKSYLYTY